MAALTTQSQLTSTTVAETTVSVTAAINQLAANQQAMQQQFAAFATQQNTTYQQVPAAQPHIAGVTIPAFPTFHTERCGQRGGQGCGTTPGNAQTPFANFVGCQGRQGSLPPIGGGGGWHPFVINPFVPAGRPAGGRNAAPMYFNIMKQYANWNACFLYGFDVEEGHTSKTCPTPWQRVNHQERFDCPNTNQYISAGYDACMKARHKSQLTSSWQCGVEKVYGKCLNTFSTPPSANPTQNVVIEDSKKTVVATNLLQ